MATLQQAEPACKAGLRLARQLADARFECDIGADRPVVVTAAQLTSYRSFQARALAATGRLFREFIVEAQEPGERRESWERIVGRALERGRGQPDQE